MRIVFTAFMVLAALGLLAATVVHVSGLLGLASPLGRATWTLHLGVLVVLAAAGGASSRVTRSEEERPPWRAALRACPAWMRVTAYLLLGYGLLNFVAFAFFGREPGRPVGLTATPSIFRDFSGAWMACYFLAAAMLYSATHVKDDDDSPS
jgi:hypothetical protein